MAEDEQLGGGEWRRSISQSGEDWEFAASNAIPVDSSRIPRREIRLEVPDETAAPRPFNDQYVADAKTGVASARASYRRMMRIFWSLRFGVIASGLLVAVLSAAGTPAWTMAAFGALAAALETVIVSTNLQNRAVTRGLYADAVEVLHGKLEELRASASATQFKLDRSTPAHGEQPAGQP